MALSLVIQLRVKLSPLPYRAGRVVITGLHAGARPAVYVQAPAPLLSRYETLGA